MSATHSTRPDHRRQLSAAVDAVVHLQELLGATTANDRLLGALLLGNPVEVERAASHLLKLTEAE